MALPSIEQVSQTINGVTVPCAHITCTEAANFRMENVLDTINSGSFTFQSVMRSNANRNIVIAVGNKEATYELTSAWAKFVTLYEDVDPQTGGRDMNIFFPAGEYWLYHTMLEHGNKVSDWKVSPEDTEEQIAQVYVEIREQYTKIMSDTERILLEALSSYTKVSDFETFKTENTAAIQLMADEITSTVAATYQTKDDASTMQTQISQNATALAGKVNVNDYTAAQIALMINQAGEGEAIISAPHIQLDGNVVLKGDLTTAGGVSISGNNLNVGRISSGTGDNANSWDLVNGQLITKYGEIGGFTISGGAIYNGLTSWEDTTHDGVYIGTDGIALGKGNFNVSNTGILKASSAEISGTMTAGARSKIGPWYVTETDISKNSAGTAAGRYNTAGEMYFGDTGLSIGNAFVVDANGNATITGNVTATGGKIGPWFIGANSISKNSAGTAAGSFYTDGSMYFGNDGLSISDDFKVDSTGKLTATGVDLSGSFNMTSGSINIDIESEDWNFIKLSYTKDTNNKTQTIMSGNGIGVTGLVSGKSFEGAFFGGGLYFKSSRTNHVGSAYLTPDDGLRLYNTGGTPTSGTLTAEISVDGDATFKTITVGGSSLSSLLSDTLDAAKQYTDEYLPGWEQGASSISSFFTNMSSGRVRMLRYGSLCVVCVWFNATGAITSGTTNAVVKKSYMISGEADGNFYASLTSYASSDANGKTGYFFVNSSGAIGVRVSAAGSYYGCIAYPVG